MATSGDSHDDREARFLALYERNRRRIERLCRLYARPGDVDDLRNEVALQLWRSLDRFDGRSAADTWVYRVALNTALSTARDRGTRLARQTPLAAPESVVATDPPAPERLVAAERRERLFAALRELPELDRAVVALYLDELPYADIADVTGLSPSHVGVRLHRARRKLAALLSEEAPRAGGGHPR